MAPLGLQKTNNSFALVQRTYVVEPLLSSGEGHHAIFGSAFLFIFFPRFGCTLGLNHSKCFGGEGEENGL